MKDPQMVMHYHPYIMQQAHSYIINYMYILETSSDSMSKNELRESLLTLDQRNSSGFAWTCIYWYLSCYHSDCTICTKI